MLLLLIAIIVGLIVGGIINMLSDELPYRRDPGLPVYADGAPRPVTAWLGITAFLLGQRQPPAKAKPDEDRARPHQDGAQLTWRYPLTEIATILLMWLTLTTLVGAEDMTTLRIAVTMLHMALLVLITVIDIEHRLILFIVILPAIALALISNIALRTEIPEPTSTLVGAVFGFGFFYAIYLGGFFFTRLMGRLRGKQINTVAFGYGDVMLITYTGALVAFPFIIPAIAVAIFAGFFGALIYLIAKAIVSRQNSLLSPIPYGPYIVIATIVVMLYPIPAWDFFIGAPL